MVIGYNFFLRRISTMLDSKEKLTVGTMAEKLNLRQNEFRDLLSIMERKGDLEQIKEEVAMCGGKCSGCSDLCTGTKTFLSLASMRSYRLTEKGRSACGRVS
ncbi:FeoC-like transcriptional regulator [Methanolobus halotolerans]|uniref:Transcriptional regulator HTH-type FeoC domain-containing protein n=1 Tax=Methanolobus halotolerans TaxID=2052935 RepID=A0A4E0Q1V1_9EURY|nr:FeoC-like transcriptional regulator [Methanolobus halotolerans]TGC11075.1 hypothetical protein CUN85_02700 [Methanolobus halotolerans]